MEMGQGIRNELTDYWATVDQLFTSLYSTMMKQDQQLHIPSYLQFIDNRNEPDRTDRYFDRLWKI